MYTYCVYPVISKSPTQQPNCLKRAETCVVLIVFRWGPLEVRTYTVAVSYRRAT